MKHVAGTHRRVLIVAFPGAQILDVVGPMEVLTRVAAVVPGCGYEAEVVSTGGVIETTSGIALPAKRSIDDLNEGDIARLDTLIVAGGAGVFAASADQPVITFLRRASPRIRRTVSICTGAFLLAEAGLLDGRRAVTHWSYVETLQARFPAVRVDSNALFVRDGNVWTSAGVTAGIDLALALVREDHGSKTALSIARGLVMFMVRPGGQDQFSTHLVGQVADEGRTSRAVAAILNEPNADLSVPALARRCGLTERTFARAFRDEMDMTPAQFVERARVDAARRLLETSRLPVKSIAGQCGFRDDETMRRAFMRLLKVAPSEYRSRFGEV